MISTELRCQKADDLLFDFDREFKFEHFHDYWVTRELGQDNDWPVVDTIYSCDFSAEGRVLRERIYKDGSLIDGIRFFAYDSNGRVANELFYEESQLDNDACNIHVELSQFFYDTENRLTQILRSKCVKLLTEEAKSKLDSIRKNPPQDILAMGASSFSEYSDNWTCTENAVRIKYTYDGRGLTTSTSIFFDIYPESVTKYFYNEHDKLKRRTYCQFGYKGDHPNRDTNTCQWVEDASFEYSDSSIRILETEELMANKIKHRTDTIFNAKGKPTRVVEHIDQVYDNYGNQQNSEYHTETIYFYDQLDRLKRKETSYDELDPVIYKYFYRKTPKSGG